MDFNQPANFGSAKKEQRSEVFQSLVKRDRPADGARAAF
jgi:hypothetical protein